MTHRGTGFSPFYLLHGIDPVLPLNLLEATYLVSGFSPNMSSSNLLALLIKQLQRLPNNIDKATETLHQSCLKSKAAFEQQFKHRLWRDCYDSIHPGLRPIPELHPAWSDPRVFQPSHIARHNVSHDLSPMHASTCLHALTHERAAPEGLCTSPAYVPYS